MDNPPQYSCLENAIDRGARWATVHVVTKDRTLLSTQHTHMYAANFYSLQTEKIPRVALGNWLGCYRVGNRIGILPNTGLGNWPV